ncbi:Rrf2 family transcriptional regulator, partial [bacterium]|nr:Rrf2 family transcriptional regulator [bacterium]
PEKITLRDVAIAVEGKTPLFTPLSEKRDCQLAPDCIIRQTFAKAEKSMFRELEKVTLQAMVDKANLSREKLKWLDSSKKYIKAELNE